MNRSKERSPYFAYEDLEEVIDSLNIPEVLKEKIVHRIDKIPLDDVYANLSDEKKEEIKEEVAENLRKGVTNEVRVELEEEYGQVFDEYVGLVVRTLFDVNLSDLKSQEQREIEKIRKELKIPGSFNPDA